MTRPSCRSVACKMSWLTPRPSISLCLPPSLVHRPSCSTLMSDLSQNRRDSRAESTTGKISAKISLFNVTYGFPLVLFTLVSLYMWSASVYLLRTYLLRTHQLTELVGCPRYLTEKFREFVKWSLVLNTCMAGLSIIHRGLIYRLRMFAIEHLKTPKNDENENEKPKTMDDYINCCNSDREELLKSHEKVIHKIYRSQR